LRRLFDADSIWHANRDALAFANAVKHAVGVVHTNANTDAVHYADADGNPYRHQPLCIWLPVIVCAVAFLERAVDNDGK